ncbi:hypothetical protein ACQPZF_17140 [Actinosynnema sp. CS-041913]|uniref:hypothetical protein n=1 Tax=Actinosynnema sp. CS-041913 TaxID=3239917 RepID=UPI003D8DA848
MNRNSTRGAVRNENADSDFHRIASRVTVLIVLFVATSAALHLVGVALGDIATLIGIACAGALGVALQVHVIAAAIARRR